ncbi:hypothetical protein SAMN02745116_02544 [Pilibacter termitis]|uniref:Uncharacterized protein n=1 Tax=Pilibacter termitis TaxID=263852 RepID=A0A1T4RDG1_9ENTE|nr:hypothetical protein [Pilibacter termitis]SKA13778.1 hypothetical protein SAMN02745116_02544 [Pilibacter termitis]
MIDKKAKISAYGVRSFDDSFREYGEECWYLKNKDKEFDELFNTESEMSRNSSYVDPDDEIFGESFALYEKSEIERAIDEVLDNYKDYINGEVDNYSKNNLDISLELLSRKIIDRF